MIQVTLRNSRVPQPNDADAELIEDILWAHLRVNSAIEHVRGRAGPDGVDLSLFLRGDGASDTVTDGTVAEEVKQCLSHLPGWTVETDQWSSQ
jgi:hypothetical protein